LLSTVLAMQLNWTAFRSSSPILSTSIQNTGRRFVSSWHDRWQQSSCRSSLCPSSSDLPLACLAMSSFVFQFSFCHLLVSILRPG